VQEVAARSAIYCGTMAMAAEMCLSRNDSLQEWLAAAASDERRLCGTSAGAWRLGRVAASLRRTLGYTDATAIMSTFRPTNISTLRSVEVERSGAAAQLLFFNPCVLTGLSYAAPYCKWDIQRSERAHMGVHTRIRAAGLIGCEGMLLNLAHQCGASVWQNRVSIMTNTITKQKRLKASPRWLEWQEKSVSDHLGSYIHTVVFENRNQLFKLLETACNRAEATWFVDRAGYSIELLAEDARRWTDGDTSDLTTPEPAAEMTAGPELPGPSPETPAEGPADPEPDVPEQPKPPNYPDASVAMFKVRGIHPALVKAAVNNRPLQAAILANHPNPLARTNFQTEAVTDSMRRFTVPPMLLDHPDALDQLSTLMAKVNTLSHGVIATESAKNVQNLIAEAKASRDAAAIAQDIAQKEPEVPTTDPQPEEAGAGSSVQLPTVPTSCAIDVSRLHFLDSTVAPPS